MMDLARHQLKSNNGGKAMMKTKRRVDTVDSL